MAHGGGRVCVQSARAAGARQAALALRGHVCRQVSFSRGTTAWDPSTPGTRSSLRIATVGA
eukprot:13453292-Alexandrium_andersonii.AAC.1